MSAPTPIAAPPASEPPEPAENLWLSLGCNVVAPVLILTKLSSDEPWRILGLVALPGLGPVGGLIAALAFPLAYGIADRLRRRRWNAISVLGLTGTLLTGGLGLLRLDPFWFAVKEAAVPLAIGAVVVGSLRTRRPLVRVFFLNPQVVDLPRIEAAVAAPAAAAGLAALLRQSTWILGGMFAFSAVMNFILARWLVRSPAGTTAFNEELGRLQLWSYAGIVLPTLIGFAAALLLLARGLRNLTGLTYDEIFRTDPGRRPPAAPAP